MANTDKRSDEYERFEELARRLAKVPKKELDEIEERKSPRTDPSDSEPPDEAPAEAVPEASGP